MTRTFKTGDDLDAALNFLGKQERPQISGEEYFQKLMDGIIEDSLKKADELRFNMITELMNDKEKGASISKLRELLN